MKKIKSINLMDNKGFWPEKAAIIDAIKDVLAMGHCEGKIPVRDFGQFRSPQWRDSDNVLVPWQSVDWYIYDSLDEERLQVNAQELLNNLANEPWRDERLLGDHYDLFVIDEDMFLPDEKGDGPGYCVGASRRSKAAVISAHRIEHIWGMPYSFTKTEIMRQLCFMLGLPSGHRDDAAPGPDGTVLCTNTCILRDAVRAPQDWERLTEDRLKEGALCPSCTEDLNTFFQQSSHEQN